MTLVESLIINTAVPNFARDEFETVEQMKNFLETRLPDTYVSRVKETGEFFIFNKKNFIDETYGKWRKIDGQYKVLPTPTECFEGNVVQYIGETNDKFSQGAFYTINKEDSGEKSSSIFYAWTFNGETYFTKKETYNNRDRVELLKKVVDDFVVDQEHFGVYYDGDGIYFDDGNELINRAPESDETIETPIYNYSWKTLTSGGSSSGGASTASEVSYKNANYPSQTNVKKALDAIWAKLDYIKPEILSFTMTPSTTIYEVGSSVDSLNFAWTLNKDVITQTLTDCTITVDDRSATYSTPITSNKTFTLTVGDGENSVSKNLSVSFQNKIYWGNAAIPAEFNSEFILGLQNNKFTTAKKGNYSINIGADEYGFIAFPSSFGTLVSWYIGGFETTVESCGEISFTNASGGVTNYSIYRTGRSGLGNITAEIK